MYNENKLHVKSIASMVLQAQTSKHFVFRIINSNTRERSKNILKLTIKTLERRH